MEKKTAEVKKHKTALRFVLKLLYYHSNIELLITPAELEKLHEAKKLSLS
jgi:hypothetical protein